MNVTALNPTPEPSAAVEAITPEMAEEYLKHNTHNRAMRKATVSTYAYAMKGGQWVLNGESIKFDRFGTLVDGQHRLAAIAEAGVAVQMLVVRNVDLDSQLTVDVGLRRSIGDHLAWRGEANATRLGAALGALLVYRRHGIFDPTGAGGRHRNFTYRDLLDLLDECPHIRESVRIARVLNSHFKLSAGSMAALHYVLWEVEPAEANIFFDQLAAGVGLEADNPIYMLRRLYEKNDRETRRMPTRHLMAVTIKAWNLWITGGTCRMLKWSPGGSTPERFPEIIFPNIDE